MRTKPVLAVATAAAALLGASGLAGAATSVDTRANDPEVAGDPTPTHAFPTNKQNEPSIAVNPVNGRLIAGSNDEQRQPACGPGPVRGATADPTDCSFFPNVGTSGVYTSADGGATWTNRGLLDDQASWSSAPIGQRLVSDGDPVIAYGPKPDGRGGYSYAGGARAHYATLAGFYDNAGTYPPGKAPEYLAVSTSDDDGVTWSAPVLASTKDNPNDFNDKESIWVDDLPTSPYFGRVYVSWTEFRSAGNGSEPIVVSVSTDSARSFGPPKQLSPAGNNGTGNGRQGSAVRSGPDGTVYVAFEQATSQVVSISRDGGQKWTRPAVIGPVTDLPPTLPGSNFRTDSFPTIAADPRRGSTTLYASWANATPAGARLVVATSTDRGAHWSAPVTVSTAAEGDAFYQGLDVAPNGRVDIGYQAQRAFQPDSGTGHSAIDSWYVRKASGGSWTAPVKVSSASTDPAASSQNNLQLQFMGDYNTLVSTTAGAWFVWTDTRTGAGCAAVDAYQRFLIDNGIVAEEDREAEAKPDPRLEAAEASMKPAPPLVCPPNFGDSDIRVATITP